MKKTFAFMLLLSVIAIHSFAFNTPPDSTHAQKKVVKKVMDCNCNPVDPNSVIITPQTGTYLITWNTPAGDPVSYYTYGGNIGVMALLARAQPIVR